MRFFITYNTTRKYRNHKRTEDYQYKFVRTSNKFTRTVKVKKRLTLNNLRRKKKKKTYELDIDYLQYIDNKRLACK